MTRRELVEQWTRERWLLLPDPFPEDYGLPEPFRIEPLTIQVVHGTIRPMRQVGLADGQGGQ